MKCPYCKKDTKVVDKRETTDVNSTRRRRECLKCARRFTTYERLEVEITVMKKGGATEPFNREKIVEGLSKACEKRLSTEQLDGIADSIEQELRKKDICEVSSKKIGDMVVKRLKSIDKVAYLRFTSVYREFEDVKMFEQELKKLVR